MYVMSTPINELEVGRSLKKPCRGKSQVLLNIYVNGAHINSAYNWTITYHTESKEWKIVWGIIRTSSLEHIIHGKAIYKSIR